MHQTTAGCQMPKMTNVLPAMQSRLGYWPLCTPILMLFIHAPVPVGAVQAVSHIHTMVCDGAEDLPCCCEGHSHASGGGKEHFKLQPAHAHMVTGTLHSIVLQTEMLTQTHDALKAWILTSIMLYVGAYLV